MASSEGPDQQTGDDGRTGFVCVLLARRHRFDKVMVCGLLADVYCLEVKNTFGPAGLLGAWAGPSSITFGKNGKPS